MLPSSFPIFSLRFIFLVCLFYTSFSKQQLINIQDFAIASAKIIDISHTKDQNASFRLKILSYLISLVICIIQQDIER